jgi:uncharacterized repeat protein (TIGR01451 family)
MPAYGYGGIDLAIDNDYDILFLSSEQTSVFTIIDAKTLQLIKTVSFNGPTDITGIVYDAARQRILGTQRNTNILYSMLWNPSEQTLTLETPYIYLSNIQHACDLAIDDNILYVSEYYYGGYPTYSTVKAYDMSNDFAYIGQVNMEHPVVSIDYNTLDSKLYGGAWGGHQNLIKKTINPNSIVYKNIEATVVGLASSSYTAGRAYITTYRNGGTIEMWDTANWTADPNQAISATSVFSNNNPNGVTISSLAGLVAGKNYIVSQIELTKEDNVTGCVSPGDEITYRISWENKTSETATDVVLKDYLPAGVTYEKAQWSVDPNDPNLIFIPPDPGYNDTERSYVWILDDIEGYETGYVDLKVRVNEKAEPGILMQNKAVMTSSMGMVMAVENTPVCCWDGGRIIYVDKTANGNNNGTSWENAYTDLQQALTRARDTSCEDVNTIYVAQGTYNPGGRTSDSFIVPEGVSVHGGFRSGGSEPALRDPKRYVTTLTGYIDSVMRHDTVVTMGNNSLLDGFVVRDAALYGYGVLCNDVDAVEISNCTIKENKSYGVYADNSSLNLKWCTIENNGYDGIRHIGNSKGVTIENCRINFNQQYGIYLRESAPTLVNNKICGNGKGNLLNYALVILDPKAIPIVYNNTIAYNINEAIAYLDNDPNLTNRPDIQNCIVWFNNQDGTEEQFAGLTVYPRYSCVQDVINDPLGTNYTLNTYSSFSGNPQFAYEQSSDPNVMLNVHLAYASACKNKGNPDNTLYANQKDMDNEDRVADNRVDIGADEIHCEDIANDWDWNHDGLVNYVEFNPFSQAWLSHDPNDPELNDPNYPNYYLYNDPNGVYYVSPETRAAWREDFNLDAAGTSQYLIDLPDFLAWMEESECLWIACWRPEYHPLDYTPPLTESMMQVFSASASSLSNSSLKSVSALSAESTESAEDETTLTLLLLNQVNEMIDTDQENSEIWQEVKNLLEQSLVETEDTAIKTRSF